MGVVYFEGNITTRKYGNTPNAIASDIAQYDTFEGPKLSIVFDGIEYICESVYTESDGYFNYTYGDLTEKSFDMVFSKSPDIDNYRLIVTTVDPGEYSLKIESVDTQPQTPDTNTKIKIIDYIMSTPTNTNWNVLSSMLGDGDWTKLKAYVETTPHNMNRMVLESFFSGGSSAARPL